MENNSIVRNIHIGEVIQKVLLEKGYTIESIRLKFGITLRSTMSMLNSESLDTLALLKWSKILKYDFFRLYSSHLMLHHGISNTLTNKSGNVKIDGIQIRKNVYTKELIQFVVNKVRNKEMATKQVISQYGIPKTTFYKWLQKYPKE